MLDEGLRHEERLAQALVQVRDAARQVHVAADHREVQALARAHIAVGGIPVMQRDADADRHGKAPLVVGGLDAPQGVGGGGQSSLRRAARIVAPVADDGQEAVAEIFQHLPALVLDGRHEAVEIIVQEFDRAFRAQGRGDARVFAHVGEQDGRADARDLSALDRARQDGPVRLVPHIDAQHLVEPAARGAQLRHEREGGHDETQDRQCPVVEALRRPGRERDARSRPR